MRAIAQVVDYITAPYTVYLILRDGEVSRWTKAGAVSLFVALFAYLVSPFDLLPDAVPLSGLLDDVLVASVVMFAASKAFPQVRLKEKKETAEKKVKRVLFAVVATIVAGIILSLALLAGVVILIVKLVSG